MSDDKKSWRELDQMRDRGVRSERKKSHLEARAEKLASKAAKQELEQLFSGSKISKEKSKKIEAIRAARGTAQYYELISAYCNEYGLPHEWDAQILVLDHKDKKLVLELLDQLKVSAPKQNMDSQRLLIQKLKVMEVSSFDPDLIQKIRELKEALLVS